MITMNWERERQSIIRKIIEVQKEKREIIRNRPSPAQSLTGNLEPSLEIPIEPKQEEEEESSNRRIFEPFRLLSAEFIGEATASNIGRVATKRKTSRGQSGSSKRQELEPAPGEGPSLNTQSPMAGAAGNKKPEAPRHTCSICHDNIAISTSRGILYNSNLCSHAICHLDKYWRCSICDIMYKRKTHVIQHAHRCHADRPPETVPELMIPRAEFERLTREKAVECFPQVLVPTPQI